jgi:hypothetical protein
MQEVGHSAHSKVVNPAPFRVQSPKFSLDYNPRGKIESTLQTITRTRSDVDKWLHFLKEHEISRPHVKVEIMVLMDLEGEDDNNLHFFMH